MTLATYTDLGVKVAELVAKYGTAMTLNRTTGQVYDKVKGAFSVGSSAQLPTHGVLLSIHRGSTFAQQPELVMAGDQTVLLSPETAVLEGDTISILGKIWSIAAISPIQPADVVLGYELLVRP